MINWILLICTICIASLSRFCQLSQSAFLSGVDAYYYALQIRFFTKTGALKISDSSPLLPLMGWTAKLGLSCEHTIILWTILIQLGCALSVFIAYRLMKKKNHVSAILPLIFAWVMLSPALAFTCIEFPKYAFSLIFLPLWPVGLVNKRLWPVTLGAIILSCVSHLTMFGLLFLILCGLILTGVTRLKLSRFKAMLQEKGLFQSAKKPVLVAGVAVLIFFTGFILGKFFLIADFKRIQFQGLQPSLWTFFGRVELPALLKAEVAVSVGMGIILLFFALKDKTKVLTRFWSPLIVFLLFIPLGSKEVMGIPERLCLMLPFIIVCSLTGIQISFGKVAKVLSYSLICLTFALVALFPKFYLNLAHPDRLNPDYQNYDQVTKTLRKRDIPMLIAHQGLNYYYKYKTMKESFPYEPESHWPKEKIWRVVYGVTPAVWSYYLPEKFLWGSGLLFRLPGPYSLIREDCWDLFRHKIAVCSDVGLKDLVLHSWLNPAEKRPEFARRRAEKDDGGEFSAYPSK